MVGLDWAVPGFSTSCRRLGTLNRLVDSTDAEVVGAGSVRKHAGIKRRIWHRARLGIDEEKLEVQAIEVKESNLFAVPMLHRTAEPFARNAI